MKHKEKAGRLFFNCRGSISVFQCLILVSLVVFIGVIIDIARILAAQRKVQSALNTSARSVMSYYDTGLMGDYGIFALPYRHGDEELQELFYRYLDANLTDRSRNFRLFDFEISPEGTEIKAFGSIIGDDVLKEQIMEYMKYRAPINMVQSILDRFRSAGLDGKLGFAEKEKEVRARRKELKGEIDALNSAIQEIKRSSTDIKDLGQMRNRLVSLSLPLDNIGNLFEKYQSAREEAQKAASREGAESTQAEFQTVADEIGHLKEDIHRNINKIDQAILEIERLRERIRELEKQLDDLKEEGGQEDAEDILAAEIDACEVRVNEIKQRII